MIFISLRLKIVAEMILALVKSYCIQREEHERSLRKMRESALNATIKLSA